MRKDYRDTIEQLTRAYPGLSKQLKKTAAYMLEYPGDVATLSMRQVAARAEVPPPTLNRLAKFLEFETYNALRDVFRSGFEMVSPALAKTSDIHIPQGASPLEATLQTIRNTTAGNVKHLFDTIDRDQLQNIIEALNTAQNVYVIGMQSSHSHASYLHYVASMCFRNWHLINRKNGDLADQLEDITPQDALLAISFKPCATDTILVAKRVNEIGTRVIGITDSRTSALATYSTDILLTPVQSPHFFESYVATVALLEMIIGFLVSDSEQSVMDNLTRLERSRTELGEYWPDQ